MKRLADQKKVVMPKCGYRQSTILQKMSFIFRYAHAYVTHQPNNNICLLMSIGGQK